MIVFVKGETLTGGDPGAGMSREEISGSFLIIGDYCFAVRSHANSLFEIGKRKKKG